MGVHGLWSMFSEICERKPLTFLAGKKVAVDLSGWVVQATQCKGLNTSRSPHLRNLFFRVSRLLQLGAYPIFVMEGKPPDLKEAAFKERNFDQYHINSTSGFSRQVFDKVLRQCQDLLSCVGIPCIKSSGEAEALCAFLCLKGAVDGVITEDSDAFLYGADVVYRDFSIEPTDSHINVYSLKSVKNKMQLNRQKLVALALLLGCDYSKGVPGIGKETALKLLQEMNCDNILQRFKDWKNLSESELFPGLVNKPVKKNGHCNRCGHLGSTVKHKKDGCPSCDSEFTCYLPDGQKPCKCPWHVNNELINKWKTELKIYNTVKNCSDFPNIEVIDEYLNYTDSIPCEETLKWNCPNLLNFQEKALNYLGWTFEYSLEKFLPLITSWQQFILKHVNADRTNFIYEPLKILKKRLIRDVSYYEVQWKLKDDNDNMSGDDLITLEYCDRFATCYKQTVEEYEIEISVKKQTKNKRKKLKSDESSRKVKTGSDVLSTEDSNPQKMVLLKIPENVNSQELISPKNLFQSVENVNTFSPKSSSFVDSFNGLLDVPLWERVKAMPKILLQKYSTPVTNPCKNNTNEAMTVCFDKDSDCNIFSPMNPNESTINLQFRNQENSEKYSDFQNSEVKLNLSPININNEVNMINDIVPAILLNFSDCDDSFVNILTSQNIKIGSVNISQQLNVFSKEKLFSPCSSPVESVIKVSCKEINNRSLQHALSPVTRSTRSPCLLYSINKSPFISENRNCLNPASLEMFNKSTPVLEDCISQNSCLNTPRSSKTLSNLVFSPLIFDSSNEDMSVP